MISLRCSRQKFKTLFSGANNIVHNNYIQDYSFTSQVAKIISRGLRGSGRPVHRLNPNELNENTVHSSSAADGISDNNTSFSVNTINETDELSNAQPFTNHQNVKNLNVKKLLTQSASYQELDGATPHLGDPFVSGPYATGTTVPKDVKELEDGPREIIAKIDPRTRTVITFPGDGTQSVGMCGNIKNIPRHIEVLYDIASNVLGYDLLDLCANGPAEKLNQTRHSQPAILVTSLAALERLRDINPQAVENCNSVAGFSVGEIAALVFAGVMTYEDALEFVKIRAEAMQLAGEIVPSGLSLVFYGADSKLGDALSYAKEWCRREYHIEYPVCSIANYLFPHCKIIGGNIQALEFIELNYKDFRLRKVKRLPAQAAFHTELMRPASEPLKAWLANRTLHEPRIRVYSNMNATRYQAGKQIKAHLPKEIYLSVKWEQILHTIYTRPQNQEFPWSFECGPGNSLGEVFKNVNRKAYAQFFSITP